ncbi:sodium:calcium antiporter [Allobacillus sp. SKP2-8]|uniref:sodium:calcium antiporter n=1 Tax=unclassified Allobacillus TaxID=2628859 RepID=UPI0011836D62|nr:sodium:calcium antiporter [Allobacillus sp. SKP2-8]TSJ63600.1 sodium:calcium antiporter [Allobacillus sp. SKP2-8]
MVLFLFLLAATIVVFAAVQLNKYGDVISEKSSLSGAMVGGLLIAGATSLPELTTSLTAVYIDNPDIAVGNMLGSNVFNLLILASVDLFYRKKRAFNQLHSKDQVPSIIAGILFTSFVVVAILWGQVPSIFNIGLEMYLLVIGYIFVLKMFEGNPASQTEEIKPESKTLHITLKKAVINFTVFAVIVFASGSVLSITGDRLAEISGMNSSFVGSVLIAASTSLPELVTVVVAFRMANYSMAAGSILGSNLFNLMLLVVTDAFYREEAILQGTDPSMIWTALLGVLMMIVMLYIVRRQKKRSSIAYAWPSIVIIIMYFVLSYMTF